MTLCYMLTQLALPKKGAQFSAHVYCDQTAAWIKVAFGKEVGLDPGHIVPDGDPVPLLHKKEQSPLPIFGQFLLWPNGWMHQDATLYGGKPHPRPPCVRWGPSSP